MKKSKTTIDNIKERKQNVNEKHIQFYDKTLSTLEFILDEYSREMTRADIEFLDMPKNYVAVLDFLISSIVKVQKGQRLALGLDDEEIEDWNTALFPTKLDLINKFPPQITFGEPKDNDTNLTNFIADTFAEEFMDRKIRNMEVVCPECRHAYRGIFNFDGFFTF